jgi:hypothetical protein
VIRVLGAGHFPEELIEGEKNIADIYEYINPQVGRIARKQYNNEQTPHLIFLKKN